MKTFLLVCLGLALVVSGLLMNVGLAEKGDKIKTNRLRHVVLFKFKPEADQARVDAIVKAFGELPSQISEIQEYEWGTNNSPENLNKELTHCFLVTFKSEADRDAYLVHPVHKKFVEFLKPSLADVTVVDYWAK